ncbi:I10R1 protein, partial [Turnix velox]|nr:I10R1 protein [Turnix velox]
GKRLVSPQHVHFDAEMTHHLLRWEPGPDSPSDVQYEVEHKIYGTSFPWTAIPKCMKILENSCDLTYYTLDPARRYYARVRAVSRNQTSPWKRTNSFSPQEASLRLAGQSLSVRGNSVHVELHLILRAGNLTVRYDDIQRHTRLYRVYIRRAEDNRTYEVVETAPEFNISNLFWDTEYCISVEPEVASRLIPATRTEEQCVTISKRDRSEEIVLNVVSSFFITVSLLGLLGVLLVCTYIKKPVRPPSVLKSFIKQSSLWLEQDPSSMGSSDTDSIQQLFLCQKEPQQDSGPTNNTDTAQLSPEMGWRLPTWPEDKLCLLGTNSGASSCTSTDSGICLHNSSSSSSSSAPAPTLSPEPQGYKQQLPTGDSSSLGSEGPCPCPTHSSGSGNISPVEFKQPHREELGVSAASQDAQQDMEFRGYLQQSKGTVEPRQDPARGMLFLGCAGSPQGPGSADLAMDTECSQLAVVKGYLKQSSPGHPHSHTQNFTARAPPQQTTTWDFSGHMGPQAPTLLSYGAPSAPLASKAGPELLKSPFDLKMFNTDLQGMLPLISSLSTNDWLTLQINPLNLLSGDNKDSRL